MQEMFFALAGNKYSADVVDIVVWIFPGRMDEQTEGQITVDSYIFVLVKCAKKYRFQLDHITCILNHTKTSIKCNFIGKNENDLAKFAKLSIKN